MKKLKHLEFIQNIIDRQAKNSFLLKGWAITLIVALCALSLRDQIFRFSLLIYCLILAFWILDSYYLWQERLFRALYDHVRKLEEKNIDFSMNTEGFSKQVNCSWINIIISKALLLFYIPFAVFAIVFFNWR